jgi:signal transduction histidine kinase
MSQIIFQNKFLLSYKSQELTDKFSLSQNKILNLNLWFSLFGLIICLVDVLFESIIYEETLVTHQLKYIKITRIVSYISLGMFSSNIILGIFVKKSFLQKLISYSNYLFMIIPFFNLRTLLYDLNFIEQNLFATIRTIELMVRILQILLFIIKLPDVYFLNILLLILICTYSPFISGIEGISSYVFVIVILSIICYFYTKQVKYSFYVNDLMKKQNDWYKDILHRMNSGFIAFEKNKINFLNKNLIDLILSIKNEDKNLDESHEQEIKIIDKNEGQRNVGEVAINFDKKEKSLLNYLNNFTLTANREKISSKSESLKSNEIIKKTQEILALLLIDVNFHEYIQSDFSTIGNNKTDFNMDIFLNEMKKFYLESNTQDNFLFIGYKDFIMKEENSLTQRFQIFFRCHLQDNYSLNNNNSESKILSYISLDQIEYEFIFNNITDIKLTEQKSAERKYKSTFLSKISHEFKNPLIGISELVEQIKQCTSLSKIKRDDKNILYLTQIKSFADYMLYLIKDLKYFYCKNLGIERYIKISETNIDDILNFCNDMSKILLIKSNKKEIKINFIKNINGSFKFLADGNKLKQVLVNLISNSIKFTNMGNIDISVKHFLSKNGDDKLEFNISDTGIGISEDQLNRLKLELIQNKKVPNLDNNGFVVGINIVKEILNQLNSKLEINSKLGDGSIFSFIIKIEKINSSNEDECLIVDKGNKKYHQNISDSDEDSVLTRKLSNEEIQINEIKDKNRIKLKNDIKYSIKIENPNDFLFIKPELNSSSDDSSLNDEMQENKKFIVVVDDENIIRSSTVRIIKRILNQIESYNDEFIFHKVKILELDDGVECLYLVYKLLKTRNKNITIISDENMIYMKGSTCAENIRNLKNLNGNLIKFISLTAYQEMNCQYIDYFVSKPLCENEAKKILVEYVGLVGI